MTKEKITEFQNGFNTAFINSTFNSNLAYRPQFIYNDNKNGQKVFSTIEYDYPIFHLSMDCFWAEIVSGNLVLKEHDAAKWLTKDELDSVEWLPADVTLIERLKCSMYI